MSLIDTEEGHSSVQGDCNETVGKDACGNTFLIGQNRTKMLIHLNLTELSYFINVN